MDSEWPYYEAPDVLALPIGAQVIVRVSPECPLACPSCGNVHARVSRGWVGTLVVVLPPSQAVWDCGECTGCGTKVPLQGHRFGVIVPGITRGPNGGCYAACELSPLTAGVHIVGVDLATGRESETCLALYS